MEDRFRSNNFDLIRLLAAMQVVVFHGIAHFEVQQELSLLRELLKPFPGVPVFFFASGFLISRSYRSNDRIVDYAQNRCLRIFPALLACTLVAISSVYLTGYLANSDVGAGRLVAWILGQITIVQFYNPEFMRGFGTGVLNGSLWTITVELQFYAITPIVYWMSRRAGDRARISLQLTTILFLMILHVAYYQLRPEFGELFFFKLAGVSFIPWIYMFLLGAFFQEHFETFHRWLSGRALLALAAYVVIVYLVNHVLGFRLGNGINPLMFVPLAALTFAAAYSRPSLGARLLGRNDISYGVYLYHIPVINLFLYYGFIGQGRYLFAAVVVTTALGLLSWQLLEKPCLRLKRHPFNPLRTRGSP